MGMFQSFWTITFIALSTLLINVVTHATFITVQPQLANNNHIVASRRRRHHGGISSNKNQQHVILPSSSSSSRGRGTPSSGTSILSSSSSSAAMNNFGQYENTGDMAYTKENIERQMEYYNNIRKVGGKDVVNDVYVRGCSPRTNTLWYVGKVARCTGTVSLETAVARQWNLIEEHAARTRPIELGRSFGNCEIWCAPGDSEVEMSKNDDSNVSIINMDKSDANNDDSLLKEVNLLEIGFAPEVVTNMGQGFRVERSDI